MNNSVNSSNELNNMDNFLDYHQIQKINFTTKEGYIHSDFHRLVDKIDDKHCGYRCHEGNKEGILTVPIYETGRDFIKETLSDNSYVSTLDSLDDVEKIVLYMSKGSKVFIVKDRETGSYDVYNEELKNIVDSMSSYCQKTNDILES